MKRLVQRWAICLSVVVAVGLLTPIRGRSAEAPETLEQQLVRQNPLGPMFGRQVLLVSRGEPMSSERQGTLEAQDGQWLRIRTKDGQLFSYSIANVIYLKLVNEAKH